MNLYHYVLAFLTALTVVVFATPSLIKVAKLKHLVDEPGDERKLHSRSIPTIGGVIIFSAFMFACFLWFPDETVSEGKLSPFLYLMASLVLLFFVGVKDDIIGMSPTKKLIAHFVVGFILVLMGHLKIDSFYGIFGLSVELPYYAQFLISVFVYIVIVNAINLIDGIDGLAAGIGFIISLTFGIWFCCIPEPQWAVVSFALAGALLGFIVFNFNPARIFMGDSGSLTIGAIVYVLTTQVIQSDTAFLSAQLTNLSTPVFAIGVLIYPLLDTLRVFLLRIIAGKSPFLADRNHLHHKLQDKGFGHKKIVTVLYLFNVSCIVLVFFTTALQPTFQLLVLVTYALLFAGIVTLSKSTK
ncbi:MAG: MraY family glycosyltransferase [Putridiphycobacter sp.]|nr:MraY family glycosyltransferase [Putridiphycobacter sp.]